MLATAERYISAQETFSRIQDCSELEICIFMLTLASHPLRTGLEAGPRVISKGKLFQDRTTKGRARGNSCVLGRTAQALRGRVVPSMKYRLRGSPFENDPLRF